MSEPLPFEEICELTRALRASSNLYWTDLRELLRERGVTPETTVVVDRSPDEDTDFLALVLDDSRTVEVEYADRHYVPGRQPRITGWIDAVSGTPEWSLYTDLADLALQRRDEIERAV